MTRSSVALSIIFTISVIGVNCQYQTIPRDSQICTERQGVCSEDTDCCTQFCAKSSFLFGGICSDPKSLVKTNRFATEVMYGKCAYIKNTSVAESNELFEEFGVSAAHRTLNPYTKVLVQYGDNNIIVTINNRVPADNQTLVQLSDIAAKTLGINDGGNLDCRIIVENQSFLYSLIRHYPFFLIVGGIFGGLQIIGHLI
ncbi:RlpA-like protein, double-psi beta-barrel domain [Cinara cedri]|uniref:RlpA-like protein, double-psi beta-barrel domain n=1 Tax=Cinara cedri TaxID=506608 RepID=A0A5E4MNG5_9HEMI|nr:RlpA-like protein, double-psi beta-barrel domain [Cinara cedri]